jgi:serine acetyltransferase
MRIRRAFQQLSHLTADLSAIVNRRHYRWLTMWLWHGSAPGIIAYRVNHIGFLLFGEAYSAVRLVLWPFFFVLRFFGPVLDIHYRAEIGPRFVVLHPNMGVLVSRNAICGSGLTLTGGNWVASRRRTRPGDIKLGNGVTLRANAMVLGPIEVGDGVTVAAGAVVLDNCPPGSVMIGVPAKPVSGSSRDLLEANPATKTETVGRKTLLT